MTRNLIFLFLFFSVSCGKKDVEPTKSSEKKIISFEVSILNQKYTASIDSVKKTITLIFPFGTSINQLTPIIKISPNSTVSPSSNITQDFSKALIFKVIAEDGSSTNYGVNVVFEIPKNSKKNIKSAVLIIENKAINALIDTSKKLINFIVPFGTNIKNLSPIIEISDNAYVIPVSGSFHDFSSPVIYSITAEDGSKNEYTFSIEISKPVGQFVSLCQINDPKKDLAWYDDKIKSLKQNYIKTNYKYLHSYYGFLSKKNAGFLNDNRPTLFDKNDPKDIIIFRLSNSPNDNQEKGESIWFYECNGTFITEGYDEYFPVIQNLQERTTFDIVKLK